MQRLRHIADLDHHVHAMQHGRMFIACQCRREQSTLALPAQAVSASPGAHFSRGLQGHAAGPAHCSQSWYGRAILAIVMGFISREFRDLGHRRHFPRLRREQCSRRSAPRAFPRRISATPTRPSCRHLQRQARRAITNERGARRWPRPRRCSAGSSPTPRSTRRRASSASPCRTRTSPSTILERPDFQGPGRPFRPRPLQRRPARQRLLLKRAFVREQRTVYLRQRNRRRGRRHRAPCRRRCSRRSIAIATKPAATNISCCPSRRRRHPAPSQEELQSYYDERKQLLPRAGISQGS